MKSELRELRGKIDRLLTAYTEVKRSVRTADARLYERWKAGGFIVDSDIVSHYPNIEEVIEELEAEGEPDADLYDPMLDEPANGFNGGPG